jgi:hypothetical protein
VTGVERRSDQPFRFEDDAHAARRRYKKDLDQIKPDLAAYNRQKEIAMGLAPGTLVRAVDASSASTVTNFNPNAGSPSMQVRLLGWIYEQPSHIPNSYRLCLLANNNNSPPRISIAMLTAFCTPTASQVRMPSIVSSVK